MIPRDIEVAMNRQEGEFLREPSEQEEVESALAELGLLDHAEICEILRKYCLCVVSGNKLEELQDLISPTRQIQDVTEWAVDLWGLPEDFICLTTGEGGGGYFYAKSNRKVYDFELAKRQSLLDGSLKPRWNSYFEFMSWYLDKEAEDDI